MSAIKPDDYESIFLRAATENEDFRNALEQKDWDFVMKKLADLGIQIADELPVRKAIENVNWTNLKELECELGVKRMG